MKFPKAELMWKKKFLHTNSFGNLPTSHLSQNFRIEPDAPSPYYWYFSSLKIHLTT